jgi:hypothetical protein
VRTRVPCPVCVAAPPGVWGVQKLRVPNRLTNGAHDRRSGGARGARRVGRYFLYFLGVLANEVTIPESIPIRHTVFQDVSYCTCVTTMLRALNLWPPLEVVFSTNS